MSKASQTRFGAGKRGAGRCAAVALLLCAGCADPLAVFQERAGDLATRLPSDRVRSAPGLDIDKFRRPPLPDEDRSPEAMVARAQQQVEAGSAPAQNADRLEWSLDQARALAVANNLELKVSLIDPAIARQVVQQERSKFDAVFRPSASYFKTDRPNTNSTSVTQVKGVAVSGAFDIPLRTGGTLTVGTSADFTQAVNPFVSFGDTYGTRVFSSLSLPLMRGAGRDVNTASIKIAGYQADIASAGTRLQITGILAEVERTYWRLVAARQQLEVQRQQFELARTLLARAERRAGAGDAAQIEVTRAQSGVASRVEGVIRAETAVLIQQRALKRLAGDPATPVDGPALIVPATAPELWAYDLPADELLLLADGNRMELLQGELQVLSDSLNIDLASDATRPVLNLLAQYDIDGAKEGFFDAVQQLNRRRFQSFSIGLEGQIPLTNGAAEAGLRRAILLRMQTLATLDSRRQTVRQEVLDALDRVASAWQRITAAQLASLLATRTLEAESRQFDRGARTSTDVLDASTSLADAQTAEVVAIADYRIALVDLAVATGTVLGGAGVTWDEVPPPPLSGDRWSGLRPVGDPAPPSAGEGARREPSAP
ncbi:MAG TPA: TolC family protein [Phycisphaerales bacterium]|nr:TolC family protein [Phycisphaerales bacterium]